MKPISDKWINARLDFLQSQIDVVSTTTHG